MPKPSVLLSVLPTLELMQEVIKPFAKVHDTGKHGGPCIGVTVRYEDGSSVNVQHEDFTAFKRVFKNHGSLFKTLRIKTHCGYRISKGYKRLTVWHFGPDSRSLQMTTTTTPDPHLTRRQRHAYFQTKMRILKIEIPPYKPTKDEKGS